jgi:hypothetical protein
MPPDLQMEHERLLNKLYLLGKPAFESRDRYFWTAPMIRATVAMTNPVRKASPFPRCDTIAQPPSTIHCPGYRLTESPRDVAWLVEESGEE